MINFKIKGKAVTPEIFKLGNQYENNVNTLHFEIPTQYESYYKYLYGVNGGNTVLFPLVDNSITVSTDLTYHSGLWELYIVVTNTELTDEVKDVVFISNAFRGNVVEVIGKPPYLEPGTDSNIDMIVKDKLREQMEVLENGTY